MQKNKKQLFSLVTWLLPHIFFPSLLDFILSLLSCDLVTLTWCSCGLNFNRHDFSLVAVWTMHNCHFASCEFCLAFLTSVSDCLLSLQSLISSLMWLMSLSSGCNLTTNALLHHGCPLRATHSVLVVWMWFFSSRTTNKKNLLIHLCTNVSLLLLSFQTSFVCIDPYVCMVPANPTKDLFPGKLRAGRGS